jgi:LPXTG-motif cell wall-anchored protein
MATLPFPLRVGAFLLILAVYWLPIVALSYAFLKDQNTISIVTMSLLFIGFFVLLNLWSRRVYKTPHPFRTYGLVWTQQNGRELLEGFTIAAISLFAMFLVQGLLSWVEWRSPSIPLPLLMLQGLLTGLGTGLGEELIFRGWLLNELERDYRRSVSLWACAVTFAVLHFIRPLNEVIHTSPQFIGLVLLGLMLVWAKRATGRLGLPIGLHGGLVWGYYVVNVGNLVDYTRRVPIWVTGINNNPLAGIIGLLFLSGLAFYSWRKSITAPQLQIGKPLE